MSIERLRALEKKMIATSASARLELNAAERRAQSIPSPTAEHADAMDKIAMGWLRVHMVEMWSSELRDIIAELGQEVGAEQAPVAWIRPDGVTTSDYGLARHWASQGLPHRPLVYGDSSPAHTSEARDAARYRALKTHFQAKFHRATCDYWVIVGELKTDARFIGEDGEQLTMDNALDAAIAAMRQEGE